MSTKIISLQCWSLLAHFKCDSNRIFWTKSIVTSFKLHYTCTMLGVKCIKRKISGSSINMTPWLIWLFCCCSSKFPGWFFPQHTISKIISHCSIQEHIFHKYYFKNIVTVQKCQNLLVNFILKSCLSERAEMFINKDCNNKSHHMIILDIL